MEVEFSLEISLEISSGNIRLGLSCNPRNGVLINWPDSKTSESSGKHHSENFTSVKYENKNGYWLIKDKASVLDNGNYTLIFNNSRSMKSLSIKIFVVGRPYLAVWNNARKDIVTVKPSTDVAYYCDGWSNPSVNISWIQGTKLEYTVNGLDERHRSEASIPALSTSIVGCNVDNSHYCRGLK